MRIARNISLAFLLTTASGSFAAAQALAATELATTKSADTVSGKPHVGIAAQVGDEAISSVDVDNRIKFIITTAHLSDTPDVILHIRPQVVRTLIDEKLEMQEAKKNDIKVTDKDVNDAIAGIEQQRGMQSGDIFKMLAAGNVPKETFIQQVRAQLLWNHLLMKKIRPQVKVSDTEIDMVSNRIVADPAPKDEALPREYKIAVISLPVDKPARENEVRNLGEKLVKEVRGGANFEEVSRHFSSSTASAGGKVETFWVTLEQVDPHIATSLRGAKAGTIIDPVRTGVGFTIIKVYETRGTLNNKLANSTPDTKDAKDGKDSTEAATVGAGNSETSDKAAKRDRIYRMLAQQKMELEAEKYLRDLRRETFIDVR